MPNIEILSKFDHSAMLKAIQASNREKIERDAVKRDVDSVAVTAGKCETQVR
jgi:hypothetical protein